jgi:hypothetical protein
VFEAVLAQQHGEFELGPVGVFDAGDLHVRVRRRRPPDCAAQTSRIASGHGSFLTKGPSGTMLGEPVAYPISAKIRGKTSMASPTGLTS